MADEDTPTKKYPRPANVDECHALISALEAALEEAQTDRLRKLDTIMEVARLLVPVNPSLPAAIAAEEEAHQAQATTLPETS